MTDDTTTKQIEQLVALPENHTLKLSSSSKVEKDSVIYETRWLDEHDNNRNLIARFRTWTNRSLSPPYRRQIGWERFSLNGHLLDREVRYSRRDDMEYLHWPVMKYQHWFGMKYQR